MITPAMAAVRPRIVSPTTGDALLLEDFVLQSIVSRGRGLIHLDGPTGAGKTTALQHLAATVASHYPVLLFDRPNADEVTLRADHQVVVYTHEKPLPSSVTRRIAPWGEDDLIEYLLARHPNEAARIFRRIRDASDRSLVGGNAELWRVVMDRMATDDRISKISDALLAAVTIACDELGDPNLAARYCEAHLGCHDSFKEPSMTDLAAQRYSIPEGSYLDRLIRFPLVQSTVTADYIARHLSNSQRADLLWRRMLPQQVREVADRIRDKPTAVQFLRTQANENSISAPMAASILHAAGAAWRPQRPDANLRGALMRDIDWNAVQLADADMRDIDLSGADLQKVVWNNVRADRGEFVEADLRNSTISHCRFPQADLCRADLQSATAWDVDFARANLSGCNLSNSLVPQSSFIDADLREANFQRASLQGANLSEAKIGEADFRGVDFTKAMLQNLRLRMALLDGAVFSQARMHGCDLECVGWEDARFDGAFMSRAYLTGTVFPRGDFRGTVLRQSGLADIQWEGADLRGADLGGVSFHLGSTRSGLVGSPYPSEGTRTGFYTDDFDQQYFKSPEEIRKANLRGANLLGAKTDGVDFYLVDLRQAIYDESQRRHFQQCGAIL